MPEKRDLDSSTSMHMPPSSLSSKLASVYDVIKFIQFPFFFNFVMMFLFSEFQDKPLQNFEMRSCEETVISRLKQMREDNHLLILCKSKVKKLTKESEVFRGSFDAVGEKMRKVSKENRIVR